ncbi:hypothetical protein [Streptomyces sp. NPDC058297]|uniref:hypothetical protein n=1 Tax=Streptomyces sp. NPDC058297 TaxID=3346433 RepID=UPI0036E2778D
MTTHVAPEIPSAPAELGYGRTVDRSPVRLAAVSEGHVTPGHARNLPRRLAAKTRGCAPAPWRSARTRCG